MMCWKCGVETFLTGAAHGGAVMFLIAGIERDVASAVFFGFAAMLVASVADAVHA